MLGFKSFISAKATVAGIELHRMLKKGQHKNAANQPVFEQFYALAGVCVQDYCNLKFIEPNELFATKPLGAPASEAAA